MAIAIEQRFRRTADVAAIGKYLPRDFGFEVGERLVDDLGLIGQTQRGKRGHRHGFEARQSIGRFMGGAGKNARLLADGSKQFLAQRRIALKSVAAMGEDIEKAARGDVRQPIGFGIVGITP